MNIVIRWIFFFSSLLFSSLLFSSLLAAQTSPKDLKEGCLATLQTINPPNKQLRLRLELATAAMQKSIAGKQGSLFLDDFRIVPPPLGNEVFAKELEVVTHLEAAIAAKDMPTAIKTTLQQVMDQLRESDRMLAETAIDVAEMAQGTDIGNARELALAQKEYAKALAAKSNKAAIENFGDAWRLAYRAVDGKLIGLIYITSFQDTPDPFAPAQATNTLTAQVKVYRPLFLGWREQSVELVEIIKNSQGIVRTLTTRQPLPDGTRRDRFVTATLMNTWDGKNAQGGMMPAGTYSYLAFVRLWVKPLRPGKPEHMRAESVPVTGSITLESAPPADTTPPVITAQVTPQANANSWHSGNVTVTFTATDIGSGVATVTSPVTVTTEGANQVVTGTATDKAGNSASVSVTINMDKTAPILTASLTPQANNNGWNNSDVTVTFTAIDSISRIDTVSAPVAVTSEGAAQVTGTASDKAGNSASVTAFVSLDKSAPAITDVAPSNGILFSNRRPTITAKFSDVGSGVDLAGVQITLNDVDITAQSQLSAAGFSFTPTSDLAEQVHLVAIVTKDKAGNQAQIFSAFTVDITPPAITQVQPTDGASLTTLRPEISAQFSDALSQVDMATAKITLDGVDVTSQATPFGSGITLALTQDLRQGSHVVIFEICDRAGNLASAASNFTVTLPQPGVPVKLAVTEGQLTNFTIPGDPAQILDLQVQVLDATNQGVSGITVVATIIEGTGSVGSLSTSGPSDTNGQFAFKYTADNQENTAVIEVQLPQYPLIEPVRFTVAKTYFIKPVLAIYDGNNQIGLVGRALPNPMKVLITDANHDNAPLQGLEVEFAISDGSGVVVEAQEVSTVSNASGLAGCQLICGRIEQVYLNVNARLSLRRDQEVTFTHSAWEPLFLTEPSGRTPVLRRNNITLMEGFVPGSALPPWFLSVVTDPYEIQVKYESTPAALSATITPWGDTDGSLVYGNFVVATPGEYKVKARFPEFPNTRPFDGDNFSPIKCNTLNSLLQSNPNYEPYNGQDLTHIAESGYPVIPVVTKGNGQIGALGKQLATPLTVQCYNRFGEKPKTKAEVEAALLAWYTVNLAGWDVQVVKVDYILDGTKVLFKVWNGDGSFVGITPTASRVEQPVSPTEKKWAAVQTRSMQQRFVPSLVDAETSIQERPLPKDRQSRKNAAKIQAQVSQMRQKIAAQRKAKQEEFKNLILTDEQATKAVSQNSGILPYIFVDISAAPEKEAAAGFVFGNNKYNPVTISATVSVSRYINLQVIDNNPDGGKSITDVPMPQAGNYQTPEAWFMLGVPEVYLVQETAPGANTFERSDTVSTWDPFEMPFANASLFHIEAKLPFDEPATTTGGVKLLDDCRMSLNDIPGAVGQVGVNGLVLSRVGEVQDRYATYRTSPLSPLIFLNEILHLNEEPPTLPPGPAYVQTRGFVQPFAHADATSDGALVGVVRIETGIFRGKGRKKFVFGTLSSQRSIEEKETGHEEPDYMSGALLHMHPSDWPANGLIESVIRHKRGSNITTFPLGSQCKFNQVRSGETNCQFCYIDGPEALPQAYVLSSPSKSTVISISGVQQGDEISIGANVTIKGKSGYYRDYVHIIKGFTWNDLQRLKSQGKSLTFAPKLASLDPKIQANIINTIEFALEPPNLTPAGEDVAGEANQTEQQKQRIAMRNLIANDSRIVQPFRDCLGTFKIPSALALEEFTKDDFHHLHWGIEVGDVNVQQTLEKSIGMLQADLIFNASKIAQRKYPGYPIGNPYAKFYGEADEKYRDIMVTHWNAILQNKFQGGDEVSVFFEEDIDFQDAAGLLKKLKTATDAVSLYVKQKTNEEYPVFNTLLESYNEAQPPSSVLLKTLAMALNRVMLKPFYDSTVFANVPLSEETRTLLAQNPTSGTSLNRLNRFLLEDAYPTEIVKVMDKAMPDGFLIRQNRLTTLETLARQPFAFYHNYERRYPHRATFIDGAWQWRDVYISPEAVQTHKLFFHGDPIDNIRTDLSDNRPKLRYPMISLPTAQTGAKLEIRGAQVLLFINRHGQIIICPDPGLGGRNPKLEITSFVEALQAADAIDQVEW